MIEYDMFLVEKIYGLLKEFDERLYSPEEMPNIDELVSLMDTTSDYDQKATLLHKFFCVDTLNFLKVIYKSCSNIELDKKKRLEAETERIERESFDAILNLEKEKKRVSPINAETKRFSFKSVTIYDANIINPFKELPENISSMEYKLDLFGLPTVDLRTFKKEIKNV